MTCEAGIAGLSAALELRNAGYQVQVLEYNARPGGRTWTLRGGDSYTELGGFAQQCGFARDQYINPGPWRIPHHHRGLLSYCKRLGVPLEPFVQINYNAYLHSSRAFGGKPQRYRAIKADYQGYIAELLAKATRQKALDGAVSQEGRERLLEPLRDQGALDKNYAYAANEASSNRRGFEREPGGGMHGRPAVLESRRAVGDTGFRAVAGALSAAPTPSTYSRHYSSRWAAWTELRTPSAVNLRP